MKTELERHKEALGVALHTIRSNNFRSTLKTIEGILTPPPEMEEVEVVKWVCDGCDLVLRHEPEKQDDMCCHNTNFIKLTGTIKRPVPRKVERSVSVEAKIDSDGMVDAGLYKAEFGEHPECHGKRGTLTFTWEE